MQRDDSDRETSPVQRIGSPLRPRFLWVVGALVVFAVVWQGARRAPGDGSLRASDEADAAETEAPARKGAIGAYLDSMEGPPLGLPEVSEARNLGDSMDAFYRRRAWEPAWFGRGWLGGTKLVSEAEAVLSIAGEAEAEGAIRSGGLGLDRLGETLDALGRDPSEETLAEADAALTWTALHLLSQLAYGPVLPEEAGIRWRVAMREVNLAQILDEARDHGFRDLEARVQPDHRRYGQLEEVRERYRSIVEDGGWPRVPEGDVLGVGEEGDPERLAALRRRLEAEGFLEGDEPGEKSVYSRELAEAVGRFQATRTLKQDGKLGPRTQEELNVPAERRLRQIELNLARWRWTPEHVWEDSIVVNIPAYHLWRYVDGESRLDMDAVVGRPDWPTPVFSDEVKYLVLNPAWNVPVSIVRDEILPSYRKNPAYLEENDMVLLEGWGDEARVVHPSRLEELAAGEPRGLHVQQRPGPRNPLGTIKFMFPNENNVYLHDTAARSLFDEAARDLSHGCVRVAKPYELAADLMREEGWSPADVEARIRGGRDEETVSLPREVPVHLLYWTVEVRPDGVLHFYKDIYGIDRAQERAFES